MVDHLVEIGKFPYREDLREQWKNDQLYEEWAKRNRPMIKVNTSPDCGNSPKNLFIQKVTIAFATGDVHTLLNAVADDIALDIAGAGTVQGKSELTKTLKGLTSEAAIELTIEHVVSHGKAGAVNGYLERKNDTRLSFCNVYEFTSAKGDCVKKITSYWIEAA